MARRLIDDGTLEVSSVVANNAMNRERGLAGVNSYARELGFHPIDVLAAALHNRSSAAWLDLCCGSGRALVEASAELARRGLSDRVHITGVDLVGGPATGVDVVGGAVTGVDVVGGPVAGVDVVGGPVIGVDVAGGVVAGVDVVGGVVAGVDVVGGVVAGVDVGGPVGGVDLVVGSVTEFVPERSYDLITCVHGLHYLGDKLGLIARAAGWLAPGGRFVADLDPEHVRVDGRRITFRGTGVRYDPRRHRVSVESGSAVRFPYRYLGADDRAGPNYTGQDAVASHYAR